MTRTITTETYTDQQATDEAVLLLARKLRRLHRATYIDLMSRLPEGARQALNQADIRADVLRDNDKKAGIEREYLAPMIEDEDEDDPLA